MAILEGLFGWTGYERLSLFLSGINILLNAIFCVVLHYYPLRRFLRVRARTVALIYAGVFSLFAVFYLCFPALLASERAGQLVGVALGLLVLTPIPFFLLRNALQNLFFTAYVLCFSLFVMGVSNWVEFRFGGALFPGVSSAVALFARLILMPIFLPLGVKMLNKLLAVWSGEAGLFWKAAWLIPAALFILPLISVNIMTITEANQMAEPGRAADLRRHDERHYEPRAGHGGGANAGADDGRGRQGPRQSLCRNADGLGAGG